MEIGPVGAELINEGRRTDIIKLIVAIRNFAKAPNKRKAFLLGILSNLI
jgi:hypothetical protein